MRPVDAARRWAQVWRAAWEELDTDAIVALYAEGCVMSTEPFREPYLERDGVRADVSGVFAEEGSPRVHVAAPVVHADRAAISWWTSLLEEGVDATLAGTSLLRFDESGLVVEQWDAWNATPDRLDPPTAWGPFRLRDG